MEEVMSATTIRVAALIGQRWQATENGVSK
jgi:hypothetical protein